MPSSHQWSIGRIFLWLFIAALIFSHVANFLQNRKHDPSDPAGLVIHGKTIHELITKLDESATMHTSGENSFNGDDAQDLIIDYSFSTKNASAEEILNQIREYFTQNVKSEGSSIISSRIGSESFSCAYSNGLARFRVFCWVLPETEPAFVEAMKKQGKTVMHVKLLQVGYK